MADLSSILINEQNSSTEVFKSSTINSSASSKTTDTTKTGMSTDEFWDNLQSPATKESPADFDDLNLVLPDDNPLTENSENTSSQPLNSPNSFEGFKNSSHTTQSLGDLHSPTPTPSFAGFKNSSRTRQTSGGDDGFGNLSMSNHGDRHFRVTQRSPGALKKTSKARRVQSLASSSHDGSDHIGAPRSPSVLAVKAKSYDNLGKTMPILSQVGADCPNDESSHNATWGSGAPRSRSASLRSQGGSGAPRSRSASLRSQDSRSNPDLETMESAFSSDPFQDIDPFGDSEGSQGTFAAEDFPTPEDFPEVDFDSDIEDNDFSFNDDPLCSPPSKKRDKMESELAGLKDSLQRQETDLMKMLSAKDEMIDLLAKKVDELSLATKQKSNKRTVRSRKIVERRSSTGCLAGKVKPRRRSSGERSVNAGSTTKKRGVRRRKSMDPDEMFVTIPSELTGISEVVTSSKSKSKKDSDNKSIKTSSSKKKKKKQDGSVFSEKLLAKLDRKKKSKKKDDEQSLSSGSLQSKQSKKSSKRGIKKTNSTHSMRSLGSRSSTIRKSRKKSFQEES